MSTDPERQAKQFGSKILFILKAMALGFVISLIMKWYPLALGFGVSAAMLLGVLIGMRWRNQ